MTARIKFLQDNEIEIRRNGILSMPFNALDSKILEIIAREPSPDLRGLALQTFDENASSRYPVDIFYQTISLTNGDNAIDDRWMGCNKASNLRLGEEIHINFIKWSPGTNKTNQKPLKEWVAWKVAGESLWNVIGKPDFENKKVQWAQMELSKAIDGHIRMALTSKNKFLAQGITAAKNDFLIIWNKESETQSNKGVRSIKPPSKIKGRYGTGLTRKNEIWETTGNLAGHLIANGALFALWKNEGGKLIGWTLEEAADLTPEKTGIKTESENENTRQLIPVYLYETIKVFERLYKEIVTTEIVL